MSGLYLLCGASTPPYRTLWKRGACTDAASREMSDSGSISTETVPSLKGRFSFTATRPSAVNVTCSWAMGGLNT